MLAMGMPWSCIPWASKCHKSTNAANDANDANISLCQSGMGPHIQETTDQSCNCLSLGLVSMGPPWAGPFRLCTEGSRVLKAPSCTGPSFRMRMVGEIPSVNLIAWNSMGLGTLGSKVRPQGTPALAGCCLKGAGPRGIQNDRGWNFTTSQNPSERKSRPTENASVVSKGRTKLSFEAAG